MDKTDMFIEMFGNTITNRQSSQYMSLERVKEVYDFWLANGKDKNKTLIYIMSKSGGKI